MATTLHLGDCLEVLKTLPDASVDALICDPPAGIAFMNKSWDSDKGGRDHWIAWLAEVLAECRRVMKPGAYALVWALPRTSHWTGMAIEDAGLVPRDQIAHLFGSGFPKSHNISAALDKAAGAEREITRAGQIKASEYAGKFDQAASRLRERRDIPATDLARQWDGWGSALKPGHEVWWLAQKPIGEKTIASNVARWGVGGLNIDGCRIGGGQDRASGGKSGENRGIYSPRTPGYERPTGGRWPANVILDEESGAELDAASGTLVSNGGKGPGRINAHVGKMGYGGNVRDFDTGIYGDTGGASRFFYCAKASRSERGEGNDHPCVKPLSLMKWLVRLVTPPNGTILDPFAGSFTTGVAAIEEGFGFIGIERETDYFAIGVVRMRHAAIKAGAVEVVAALDAYGMTGTNKSDCQVRLPLPLSQTRERVVCDGPE